MRITPLIDVTKGCLDIRHAFYTHTSNEPGTASFVGCFHGALNSSEMAIDFIISCLFRDKSEEMLNGTLSPTG